MGIIRFTQTKLRGEANLVQIAAVEFYDNKGNLIKVKTASNPEGCNPDENLPSHAIDGDLKTKWADMNKGSLVCEFSKAFNVATYRIATANDCSERDPVRWKLGGSTDKKNWAVLDDRSKSDVATPEDRNTWTDKFQTNWKREQDKKAAAASKKKTQAKNPRVEVKESQAEVIHE